MSVCPDRPSLHISAPSSPSKIRFRFPNHRNERGGGRKVGVGGGGRVRQIKLSLLPKKKEGQLKNCLKNFACFCKLSDLRINDDDNLL
mmetsp:Transcript_52199/g.156677  ORF Transcript_52199/g.156677 Transcript_52199/m.156677 type:complete len:88 (+) Transcript_52199:944-1207(+)